MRELREAAFDFLLMAAKDDQGRRQHDPVFEAVTERRQGKGYSSCGDLAHWLLFRLGFRFPWLNRAEHQGWRVGQNLSLVCAAIAGGANPHGRRPTEKQPIDAGDVLVVNAGDNRKAHVVVVMGEAVLEQGAVVKTAEYGQFDARYGRACGRTFTRVVGRAQGARSGLRLGSSTLDSVLSLAGLAQEDVAHVAQDDPIPYYEQLAAAQRVLRVTSPAMRGADVRWWCEELRAQSLNPGRPDDIFGKMAHEGTVQFQEALGLGADGKVETDEWCSMMGWSPVYATAEGLARG